MIPGIRRLTLSETEHNKSGGDISISAAFVSSVRLPKEIPAQRPSTVIWMRATPWPVMLIALAAARDRSMIRPAT